MDDAADLFQCRAGIQAERYEGGFEGAPALVMAERGAADPADRRAVLTGADCCRWQGPQPPILPPTGGFLFLDRDKVHGSSPADVPAGQAAFMADSQVPWGVDAPGGTITPPWPPSSNRPHRR